MGKRLQETRRFHMMSSRSSISVWYYVSLATFLCVGIVLLRSSAPLRLSPPLADRIATDRETADALLQQEIARHRFMQGSVWEELQQKQLGREKTMAIPRTHSSVSTESSHDNVDIAARIRLPVDENCTTEIRLSSPNNSVGVEDRQAGGMEKKVTADALEQVNRQRHDHPLHRAIVGSPGNLAHQSGDSAKGRCDGQRVYVYPLPAVFHRSVVDQCENNMVSWLNFCPHVQNQGFGRKLNAMNGIGKDWYATDPYMLEVIFHARMASYRCITHDPNRADAFFIPYYSGLDALRFLYGTNRSDAGLQGSELVAWLEQNAGETWRRRGGVDHFIVMGRTAWDFGRPLWEKEGWGTVFLSLPQMENVTSFLLERRPWQWNEQAIPYPTSFHPTSLRRLRDWQNTVRSSVRPFLFAFVGAPRSGNRGYGQRGSTIRKTVIEQCIDANNSSSSSSPPCAFIDCREIKCAHNPNLITERLLQSEFCLQPPGDTETRRSTFDGMLSGCIPVFFHENSAYTQYSWHLPEKADQYSVFIPKEKLNNVHQVLSTYSSERIRAMRETIIDMIPNFIYASAKVVPEFEKQGIEDAFDLSMKGILRRVAEEGERR